MICDHHNESLQRLLRKRWTSDYKTRWKDVTADKEKHASSIMEHRFNNEGKSKRILNSELESLQQKRAKRKSKVHRNIYAPLTYEAFRYHFSKPLNGGFMDAQLVDKWQDIVKSQAPVDSAGVVAGKSGFKRYRVKIGEQEFSDSGEEEERSHLVGMRPRKQLKAEDADDFVAGRLVAVGRGLTRLTTPQQLMGILVMRLAGACWVCRFVGRGV